MKPLVFPKFPNSTLLYVFRESDNFGGGEESPPNLDPDFYKTQKIVDKIICLVEYLGLNHYSNKKRYIKQNILPYKQPQISSGLISESIFSSKDLKIKVLQHVKENFELYSLYIWAPGFRIQILRRIKNLETGTTNASCLFVIEDEANFPESIPREYVINEDNTISISAYINLIDLFGGNLKAFPPNFSFGKKFLKDLQKLEQLTECIENTTLEILNIEAKKTSDEVIQRIQIVQKK